MDKEVIKQEKNNRKIANENGNKDSDRYKNNSKKK